MYHLAAVYDLGVDTTTARRVNVDGTEHVLALAEAADRYVFTPRVPRWVLGGALRHVPGLARATGLDPEAVAYVDLPTRYDAGKTVAALEGAGIHCPGFETYVDRLVDFVREHPTVDGGPMV